MGSRSKKVISKALAFILIFTLIFNDMSAFASDTSNNRKIDVWDFGGIQTSGELYNNNITPEILDSKTTIKSGTFVTTSFGDLAIANPEKSDRSYYSGADGTTVGVNSSGTWGPQKYSYDDGYNANGVYYANGTGGSARRFLTLDHVVAGDKISVYGGTTNGNETMHFVHAAVTVSGTTVTVTPDASQAQDSSAPFTTTPQRVDFTAQHSGSYQIYLTAGAGGKPYYQRVVRTPGVKVSGTVNINDSDLSTGYALYFTNQTTGDKITVNVNADHTFDTVLATGYDYIATLKDITSHRFSDETKKVSTSTSDISIGKSVNLDVVANQLVRVNGKINGFDSSYNVSNLQIDYTPPAGSLASKVTATVNTKDMTYIADVQDGVDYTTVISGVNDYTIVGGGSLSVNADTIQDITVAPKSVHTATGKFQGLSSTAQISSITFTHVDDGYIYNGDVSNGGYTASLRDGAYSVTAVSSENYSTSAHVVMNGKNTTKDILFRNNTAPGPLAWVPDLYVGDSSKPNNYSTVKDALDAAARMNPTDEAHRITIHIAPGVYRAQLIIKTPYITLVNTNPNPTSDPSTQVKITWYYGIGYKYYSAGSDGFYNAENAFDKYSKNIVSKWGGTVYLTSTATDFKAKNIIFENSFNKYMTDEELADGVELANIPTASSINENRRSFTDVTSKAATERAAAIIIEGNRAEFENSSFIGSQDTLYTGGSGTNSSYFKNSYIEGNTDYIFGDGNVVFDNTILNFAGYSERAVGGYITAAKDLASHGYLFRNSTITANSKYMQTSGFFGRPWGAGARVTFLNTKLQNSSIIDPKGWTDMTGTPENANYREYNTTYNNSAVDTSQRRAPVLTEAPADVIDVAKYFGDWTPSFYTADRTEVPTFKTAPFFTTDDDINIPYTGNTIRVGYEFKNADDNLNDSSFIQWYRVSPEGTETLINEAKAYISKTYKITSADVGHYIKAVVTPETVNGLKGEPMPFKLDNLVRAGSSGGGENEIPDGQRVNIYIAGDSTVKTYGPTSDTGGWGEYFQSFFNSDKVNVVNYANGGRSSRSFINEGSLDKIASTIKSGDYLLIQFGHNDGANSSGYLQDRFVSMGQPDANGIYPSNPGVKEPTPTTFPQYGAQYYPYTSGTFKWYLQQYIDVAKEVGATPILVTPVSRKYFTSDGSIRPHHDATDTTTGTITTSNNAYVKAVEQLGEEQGINVVGMFDLTKDSLEKAYKNDPTASNGISPLASAIMVQSDSTHNNKIGGFYNGALMAKKIQGLGYNISSYVIPPVRVGGLDSTNTVEFEVDSESKVSVYTPDTKGAYTNELNVYWTGETQALIDSLSSATPQQPTITSIVQPAEVTVTEGDAVTLPQTVTAVYSDGTQKNVGVTWDEVNTANVGVVDVHGAVVGFAAGVTIKVTVTAKTTSTPTIWIVGDSTVSSFSDNYYYPRYGWGTQIDNYLDGSFTINNLALSGRSSKSYISEPEYKKLLSGMKSGDYLLVGFGHNDEKAEVDRYTNPNGTYQDKGSFANSLYENYIKPAQAAGTQVILNTPIVRRTATGVWSDSNLHITSTSGEFAGGDYSKAIKDLGEALQIPVVDLTSLTKDVYDQLGPEETLYMHAWTSSKQASVDNTHTNIWGGKYNAYLITREIKKLGVNGLAEHVIDATAPTKANTLSPNPNYVDSEYTGNLPQSTLWPDYGIWKGTVFGDVGGVPSTANQTLGTDSNGSMHIAVANNKGKIASTADGMAMYYYKVPANSTFTLSAKAKINSFSLNDQVSFGLMARDDMYIDSYMTSAMGDYVAAAPLKLTKGPSGGLWNSFARKSGVLTQGGTAVYPIAAGDTVDLRIEGNSDGYATTFGNEATITGGFDFKLTSIDSDYVYVGMFVARNADIAFSDIKLVVDGVEVTDEDTSTPTPDIEAPVWTNGTLLANQVTQTGLTLTWNEAQDNVGVTGYEVYEGTTLLHTVTDTTYKMSDLTPGTSYTFTVKAGDAAGNWSKSGPSVTVATLDVSDVADTTAPSWTNGTLSANQVTQTGLTLTWNEAQDNIGVIGYEVYEGSKLLTTVTGSVYSFDVSGLSSGTSYTFTVQAGDAAGNWSTDGPTVTVRTDSQESSPPPASGDGGETGTGTGTPPATTVPPINSNPSLQPSAVIPEGAGIVSTPTVTVDKTTGVATASVNQTSLNNAITQAKADENGTKTVVIVVPKAEGATAYELKLPAAAVNDLQAAVKIAISTEVGTVVVPSNMLSNVKGSIGAKQVTLTIARAEVSKLPANVTSTIGSRPVVELNIAVDGKRVDYNNLDAPVTMAIPYKPTAEEAKDIEHLVVVYIDEAGNVIAIPSGKYNPATQEVTFTTTHFSKYAVGFVHKSFGDLTNYPWAEQEIGVMASKGIINGTSETTFTPGALITRADFLHLLVKTLNLNTNVDTNFEDVDTSIYYYHSVGVAKKLGIADGIGGNQFNPKASITRQDMMVFIKKALDVANKLKTVGDASDLEKFSDKKDIASYALESAATLVREGIVQGQGSVLSPTGNATRAETAVMMYRIYNK